MADVTVSEILAQSRTTTPDFMATVLSPNRQPFQEGGIVLPNPPKPDNSQAERSAINRQQYLEDEVLAGRPPPGEEWPDEKYLAISELLDRSVLPGGERDPLLNPDRPRTVDAENPTPIKNSAFFGEPVPVTDAEYMMREAGRFPNRQNPLALIGRDTTLEKTATTDMSETTGSGFSVDPGGAYEDLNPVLREVIRESDRPELVNDLSGSVVIGTEIFDEEFGPQVIVEGTPNHEWMHAGFDVLREADPDFELPQFPSKYAGNFSDKLNEEMWVRVIHAHTEDLSAVPTTTDLVIDGEVQFDDNGSVKLTETNEKEKYDEILLQFTGGDTDYWLSQPSAIRGINSILEKAHEVGRELGSFAVTETPSDRAQFAPGGQRRYEGAEISARQPFQEGGIASLPKSPVLGGQQHMLAYITPEEASTLRAQGGGVTPDGGQYTGPGGIASFFGISGGQGAAAAAAAAAGDGGTGTGNPFGGYANPFSGLANASVTAQGLGFGAEQSSYGDSDGDGDGDGGKTPHYDVDAKKKMDKYANLSISQFNSIFGKYAPHGYSLHGEEFSKADIADMTPAQFDALKGNPATNIVGDPNSTFGKAVSAFGLTALGLVAPALTPALSLMSLARTAAKKPGDPPTSVMGLVGDQAAKAFGYKSVSDAVDAVASEVGFGDSPDATDTGADTDAGFFSGLAGDVRDAVSNASIGPPTTFTPSVPGGPSLPPVDAPLFATLVPEYAPVTTTETLLDATSSDYTAEQLAQSTGSTVAQAQAYLDSRYAQLT